MSAPRSTAAKVFHALYVAVYVLIYLVLVALLLSVPADIIRQSIRSNVTFNILVIAVSCIVVVLIVAFIYATRLYMNRSVLASIPKPWIPIEKGDGLPKNARKMIVAGLSRSAAIAYAARPRVEPVFSETAPPTVVDDEGEEVRPSLRKTERRHIGPFRLKKAVTAEDEMGISLPPVRPVWGDIEHPGWASPTSIDLPNLQYESVISELPNLIEAKAITLAPVVDDGGAGAGDLPPSLDLEALALLQRTEEMGLRDYLMHLIELGVLEASGVTTEFIAQYEYARFATRPLHESRFRELMHLFAEILRGLRPLDPAALLLEDGSDIDDDAPQSIRSHKSSLYRSSSASTTKSRLKPQLAMRESSTHTWQQYRTAPTTPQKTMLTEPSRNSSSSSSGANTFAQSRQPYAASTASSDAGSVIRLSQRDDETELPYVLNLTETRASTF